MTAINKRGDDAARISSPQGRRLHDQDDTASLILLVSKDFAASGESCALSARLMLSKALRRHHSRNETWPND